MKTFRSILLVTCLIFSITGFAQRNRDHGQHRGGGGDRGHHGGYHQRHANRTVVVHRSPYRPSRVVVYHPYWGPRYAYHRRWVFFPRYNIYWDNWRNHYVYWDGAVWISQPTVPAVVVNVNLEKEKSSELREDDDDVDDIYRSNDQHKTNYKGE